MRRITVQLDQSIAELLIAEGTAEAADVEIDSLGGIGDLAPYAAVIATNSAVIVTLFSAPDVFASIARRIRPGAGKRARWLNARGPGGEVNLSVASDISETVVAGLLKAIWTDPEDGPADQTVD